MGFLYPAALLSGATALIYEIVWARKLSLVLGSATSAAAAVLSAFMLGLALGAVLVGGRADASRRPLRWYGVLEVGIGVFALGFDTVLELAGDLLPGQPWLVSVAVLTLPAALMGGTLPVMARAGADSIQRGTGVFGGLYGINTLGAVCGALLTVFVLLEPLGLGGTTTVAAVVNIVIGVVFWVLGTMAGERESYAEESDDKGRRWTGDAEPFVVLAFFIAGFAGLTLQVAWIRFLVYYLEGFTIAFGLMLAAYLFGLGTGAFGGTFLALRSANPRRLLARVLMVEAILAVGTLFLAEPLSDKLEALRRTYATAETIDFTYAMWLFLGSAAIVFPATFCAGMLMPIVTRIALSDRESIGLQTGVVYAASTFGAVIAPAAAAFWLVPSWGVPGTIAWMAAFLLAAGTYLALSRGIREWVFAGVGAFAFVLICLLGDLSTPLVQRSHVFRDARTPRRLLAFRDGEVGDVSVVEELTDRTRRLYIDGFSAAETSRHYGYMRLQGHLPVLLHEKPRRVLVIAFGTGTTAGAVAVHPEVERVVCVEIEPGVYEVADRFSAVNRDVLKSKKTTAVVADGREYVRRGERFDVVTLEPLMPYTPAAIYLYTREFYAEVKASLDEGGLCCQWIPPQGVSAADTRRLVAAMTGVFDHVSLWYFPHAMLVLGGDATPRIDPAVFLARCSRPEVLQDLRTARVGLPSHLLGAAVCAGDALESALDGAEPFTDNRTDLEFRPLPRRFGKRSMAYHAENLAFLSRVHSEKIAWLDAVLPDVATARHTHAAVLKTLAVEMERRVSGEGARVPSTVLNDVIARDRAALFAQAVAHRRLYEELCALGRHAEAAQLTHAPDRSAAYLALADAAEAEQKRYYLTLAVRQNGLLDPARPEESARQLEQLAEGLEDEAERRFLLNRARALRGEPFEEGEEKAPTVALPDLRAALDAGDEEQARAVLDKARQADLAGEVDRQAWEWWQAASDRAAAALVLDRIGSSYALRAALRVYRKRQPKGLITLAPFFAARYPASRVWEELCAHPAWKVREAAADSAKTAAGRAHLEMLAQLCGDQVQGVRLSAILAFREIVPDADKKTGYDYRAPSDSAVQALRALASQ